MARLIFVNKNKYDIFVPTPNGAGRRVKVDQAVEGDYFIDVANTGQLQRFNGDPDTIEIICNYQLNSYLKASQSSQAGLKAETAAAAFAAAPVVEPVAPEVILETPVEVGSPPLPVIDTPVLVALTASEKDLFKLSMEELRMIAATQGIDAGDDVKKKTLVKMINANAKK